MHGILEMLNSCPAILGLYDVVFVRFTEDQSVWSVFYSYTAVCCSCLAVTCTEVQWVSQVSEGKGSRGYVQRSGMNKVTLELKLGVEGRDGLREE